MKLILKLAALILALGSVACLILANMERISDWMACLWAKVQAKKELICRTCPVPKGRSGIPAPVFFLLVDLGLVLQVPQAGVAGRQDERLDLLHHGEGKQGRRDQSALVIVLLHGHHADALADF